MAILTAKYVFSQYGVTSLRQARKVMYGLYISVKTSDKKQNLRIDLSPAKYDLLNKKEPVGLCISNDFLVIQFREEYMFYNDNGDNTATYPITELGEPFSVQEDCIIFIKGNTVTAYDSKGTAFSSHILTDSIQK